MPGLNAKAQTLVLRYSDLETAIPAEGLCGWVEYSTLSNFRRVVLTPLHGARFIEHDRDTDTAVISPTGIEKVERELLKPATGGQNAKPKSKRRPRSRRF